MKKILFVISLLALIWQCSDKNPLDISSSSVELKSPSEKPIISRSDYTSNGNFLPGYQNGKIRSDRITLDWPESADGNFLCYKVYRNNSEKTTITDKTVHSYLDSNLVQNYYFSYRIVTMNKTGMFKSDTIRLKTPQFLPPYEFGYQVLSATSIRIFWKNRAESATNFEIYRKLYNEPSSAFQLIATSADTFYADNNVVDQENYHYQIVAYNQFESTFPSNYLHVYVNYDLDPPYLSVLNQVPGARSVNLEWTDYSTAEDRFLVYRRKATTNYQYIGSVVTDETEYVDNDTTNSLKIDSTYYYAVRAYNITNNDTSNFSNELSITITVPQIVIERTLKYYVLGGPEQPDAGENVDVYYYSNTNNWVLIRTIQYFDVGTWTYFEDIINNADAQHAGFKIKFEQTLHSGSNFDNYYLDNVEISQGLTTIFSDNFNGASISYANWPLQTDVMINNSYYISSPYSVIFDGSGVRTIESRQIPW